LLRFPRRHVGRMQLSEDLLNGVLNIAEQAGAKIMEIYRQDHFVVQEKADHSPLTEADMRSHQHICSELTKLTPDIPVLSEESDPEIAEQRHTWETLWLVDPLDGTKEFIGKSDEFTVNIALIHRNQPILGVIVAPALGASYYAMEDFGAYKKHAGQIKVLNVPLPTQPYRVVASRRHGNDQLVHFLAQLESYDLVQAGSALKFCLIAEGKADVYPRLAPTYEWDTAAGHAILNQANGRVTTQQHQPFIYNARKTLLNQVFVACHKHFELPAGVFDAD